MKGVIVKQKIEGKPCIFISLFAAELKEPKVDK